MWIQTSNNALRALKLPWMDDRIDFTSNHKANVSESTGERLIDERDDITAVSDTDDVPDDGDDEELGDHYLDEQPDVIVTDDGDDEADNAE